MSENKKTSGLLLPLRLISQSLKTESENSHVIRNGIVKMLEDKMGEVENIPIEEVPKIKTLLQKIAPVEPKVADEVSQMIEKFHPNL